MCSGGLHAAEETLYPCTFISLQGPSGCELSCCHSNHLYHAVLCSQGVLPWLLKPGVKTGRHGEAACSELRAEIINKSISGLDPT